MSRRTWLNRCTRWTTLVALVLATMAPSVAHALRHARGEMLPWSQVCSATGSMRVIIALDDDGMPAEPAVHAFGQCPYCALHHDGTAPPLSATSGIGAAAASQALPALFLHAPRPLSAWRTAQPRAPPQAS